MTARKEAGHFIPRIFANPTTTAGEHTPTGHGGHRISRRTLLSTIGLAGAGLLAADYQANVENSILARLASKAINWLETKGLVKKTTPSNEFDNQSDYGKIRTSNSLGVPIEEIRERTRIENGKAIHIGSLFGPEIAGNITYVKGLPFVGIDKPTYEELKQAGVKNAIAFTDIPLGTTVYAPFEGKISRLDSQWSDTFLTLNLVFQDNEGKWYNFSFSGARDVGIITQAPKLDPNTRFSNLSSWLEVKIGDPLFTIQSKTLVPSSYLMGFNYPSQLLIESQYGPNGFRKDPWLPTDIFFLTREDKILSPITS